MRAAIAHIEQKGEIDLARYLNKLYKIMIGICIALVFALGWDIIQWNTNNEQSSTIKTQAALIRGIQSANHLASLAAHKSCMLNKPRNTKLISALSGYFTSQKISLQSLVNASPAGSKEKKARQSSLANSQTISSILTTLIPIKCPTLKQLSNQSKLGG